MSDTVVTMWSNAARRGTPDACHISSRLAALRRNTTMDLISSCHRLKYTKL